MDPAALRQAEQFVRPLYAGLDGIQTFGQVERLRARVAAIREGLPASDDLLDLLILFHGAVDRLGSLSPGGRLDLFLKGLGLDDDLVRRLRLGLSRLREDPRGPEEELVQDALLLESAGVAAAAERLMAAGKKKIVLSRALAQLDPGPPAERYRTPRARELGTRRRQEAEIWIEELRRKVAAEA